MELVESGVSFPQSWDGAPRAGSHVGMMGWARVGVAYRSMMEMMGATSTAAEAALTMSAPSRHERFLVFHWEDFSMAAAATAVALGFATAAREGACAALRFRFGGGARGASNPSSLPSFISGSRVVCAKRWDVVRSWSCCLVGRGYKMKES